MKRFTKICTVAVAVSMIGASVVACSSSKKDDGVDGKYTAEYDMTDKIAGGMGLRVDTDEAIIFEVELELEDGNYSLYSDGEKNYDAIIDYILSDEVKGAILDQFGVSDMTEEELNELVAAQGYDSYDDYLVAIIEGAISADDLGMAEDGTYELDGDELTFTPDDDGEIGSATFDDGEIIVEFESGETVEFTK